MTPKLRLALYTAAAGALAVLVVLGLVSQGQSDALLLVAESILQLVAAVALIVATRKLSEDSWSNLRGALYVTTSALLTAGGATAQVKRTPVLTADVAAPNREAVVVRGEIAPGAGAPRHTHPGDEISYVLEGEAELLIDGEETNAGRKTASHLSIVSPS